MHGIIVLGGPDASVAGSIGKFFSSASYMIGGYRYSLDDMEHGVLRANAVHPTTGRRFFGDGDSDPRAKFALAAADPRVHCALVCGARSCPPVRVFDANNLEKGLALAARTFCGAETEVDVAGKRVVTSKIFDWYKQDFGTEPAAVLERLASFMPEERAAPLREVLAAGGFTLEYRPYDWSRNSRKAKA